MSRQDADDEQPSSDSDRDPGEEDPDQETAAESGGDVDAIAEDTGEEIEEIAAEPEADVEEILAGILAGEADESDAPVAVDPESATIEQSLIDRVEQQSAAELARVIASLRETVDELEAELEEVREEAEEFESRLKRKQADFQNYKKRQKERMEEEKQRATEDLVGRLLDVRDNLARALEQDESTDIRDGVASTLDQFDRELDRENVQVIEPDPGTEVDPRRHEVLIRIDADQPEDTVAELHRPGYEMAGKVLRPAQVAVSEGSARGENDLDGDGTGEDDLADGDERADE